MKGILLCCALLLLPGTATAAEFRHNHWGDGESAIRERGGALFHSESTPAEGMKMLIFNDAVAGLDVFIIYLLHQDRLVQTKYLFPQGHTQSALFLEDYAQVNRVLRNEIGPPDESGEYWRNGAFEKTMDKGQMVAVGELMLMSRWETADTEIRHVLRGESLAISHEIRFTSRTTDVRPY